MAPFNGLFRHLFEVLLFGHRFVTWALKKIAKASGFTPEDL
jgi:hypothetical protein